MQTFKDCVNERKLRPTKLALHTLKLHHIFTYIFICFKSLNVRTELQKFSRLNE